MSEKNSSVPTTDTFMGVSWKEFLEIIKNYGFEILVQRRFKYSWSEGAKPSNPEFIIAAHKGKYLLLCATSYVTTEGEHINGGKVYGTLNMPGGNIDRELWQTLDGCSGGGTSFGYEFNYDIRYNLISKLESLGKHSKFIKWNDPNRFLWLLDYVQEAKEKDSWSRHRDEFINQAPSWVKNFILPDRHHQELLKKKQPTFPH